MPTTRPPVPPELLAAYNAAFHRTYRTLPATDTTTSRAEKIAANQVFANARDEWHATRSPAAIANGIAALDRIGASRYPRI